MNYLKEPDLKKNLFLRCFIGIAFLVIFSFLFPYSESIEGLYHVGTIWAQKDLVAPFSFPIYKDSRTYEREKAEAAAAVYPVVENKPNFEATRIERLKVLLEDLRSTSDAHRKWTKSNSIDDSLKFLNLAKQLPYSPGVRWSVIDRWRAGEGKNETSLSKIDKELRQLIPELYRTGIIDSGKLIQSHKYFAIRQGFSEEVVPTNNIITLTEARSQLQSKLHLTFGESDLLTVAENLGSAILTPNLKFNLHGTQQEVLASQDKVPRTLGFVQAGERIIGKNERITEDVKVKLDSYRRAKSEEGSDIDRTGQRFGIIFHVLLIVGLYSTYLFLFRKKIFNDNSALGLIALLFCLEGFFAYATGLIDLALPVQLLIFVPAASMLLTIIFDSRVAFYGTVMIAFLIAGIRGNDYAIALESIIAGCLGAYTVRDIKSRTQIFQSIGFIFLGYLLTILALGWERFEDVETIGTEIAFAFGNALISSVLTYALLIFFEHVFNITTDLRLVELADFNQPLLERLSEEAPGTFHHSLMLGNLSEAAADEIGANSILAKVGAYYHDVGKLIKPDYFIENQVGLPNRHTKLKPRMSAKIIISHVIEGMELARAYNIPEVIVDFIPQHHGVKRLSFFYDKALKQAASRKNNKEVIRDEDYHYPGPKPQTKETAIVMLADTVEATTRAMVEVTPQSLETIIDNLIKQQLIEGELEECTLTMRDIAKIKAAFLQILIGIHHHRMKYPDQETVETPALENEKSQNPPTPEIPAPPIPTSPEGQASVTPPAVPEQVSNETPQGTIPVPSAIDNQDTPKV
ncbi:MAG: HD family phosphohydrolase [Bacteroidota bacterium]